MQKNDPESMTRRVIEACADCDICRYLMDDTPCQVFPELFRLHDKQAEKKENITAGELRSLMDLCNFCALCPCPNVRSDIMKAKHAFVDRDGIKPAIRLLEDVKRVATLCGAYPRLTNSLLGNGLTGGLLKRLSGIHAERRIPAFPLEAFPIWAQERGLHLRRGGKGRKVAYFAGCTGQYLFPDVPMAVVEVLQHNGVEVYYPPQKCCGMPGLRGDRPFVFDLVAFNMECLCEAVEAGYDIVCSCPTCGYMLKNVLSDGAFRAAEYREFVDRCEGDASRQMAIARESRVEATPTGKPVFEGLFKDKGYFAALEARKRIKVASHTYDLGEYLRSLHRAGELKLDLSPLAGHVVYYPPCHLREQNIGQPYAELLELVPGISVEKIEGSFYCCGIAGIMGFKRDFHEVSVNMGKPLMERIKTMHPERLLTDCLSCRIQFNQLLPYKVSHPIEVLGESYATK